jgi:uncharacterized membrane protein YbhN (UPF0104 family)
MSTSPLSPDDIRAAAEVHAELGPEYRDAVVESFLAKIDNEIGARIDARLGTTARTRWHDTDPVMAERRRGLATGLVGGLTLGTVATGVPLTALAVYIGNNAHWIAWQSKLWLFWVVMALVYAAGSTAVLAWNRRRRQLTARRHRRVIRQVQPRAGA